MANYILNGHEPQLCENIIEWARWYEKANRRVAQTDLPGGIKVSTVFLGLDHGWDGKIELFETMIFGGEHDQEQWRYSTWEQAEAGHQRVIELIYSVNKNNQQ